MTAQQQPSNLHQRIGIVGAGAAGLSAARALKRRGYEFVTVLERSDRVGGKCYTIHHEGRSYELGAGSVTPAYRHILELLRETGLRATAAAGGQCIDLATGKVSMPVDSEDPKATKANLDRLWSHLRSHRQIQDPGLTQVPPEMQQPFSNWLSNAGLDSIADAIRPWYTGFGYGYFDEVAAIYVLKYLAVCQPPPLEILDGGYQNLWERVANGIDVRLSQEVRSVRRDAVITVETDRETHEFDRLILACPLDDALGFLDGSAAETELFGQIQHCDYHVVAAFAEGMPRLRFWFIPEHMTSNQAGRPMFVYRRWLDSDLHLFYCYAGQTGETAESEQRVRETVDKLGATARSVFRTVRWKYFPHVPPGVMADGYYERLEALQGQQGTFYTGELMSFSDVEEVTAYSYKLVDRFF